jgi:hypothetical protein
VSTSIGVGNVLRKDAENKSSFEVLFVYADLWRKVNINLFETWKKNFLMIFYASTELCFFADVFITMLGSGCVLVSAISQKVIRCRSIEIG